MRVPIIKRMVVEDFPSEQRGGLAPLIQNVNDISDNLVIALTRNLSAQDNLDCQVQQLSFLYQTSPNNTFPLFFKITMHKNPVVCMVGNIVELVTPDYPNPGFISGPVYVSWQNTGTGQVQINNITGLTVNNTTPHMYQITLLLF